MKNIKLLFKILILTPISALVLASLAFTALNYPAFKVTIPPSEQQISKSDCNHQPLPKPKTLSIDDIIENAELKNYINKSVASIVSESHLQSQLSKKIAFQTLSSTVRITVAPTVSFTDTSCGTGVIISSQAFIKNKREAYKSYILTNHHVVRDSVQVKIEHFYYVQEKIIGETNVYAGKVLCRNEALDVALIEVISPREIGHASPLLTDDEYDQISLYDSVFVSGCPLGEPPCITNGNISYISFMSLTVSAHSIFGNSGGGLFSINGKVIGIVNKIGGFRLANNLAIPDPNITHTIPVPIIRSWLLVNNFKF